MTVICAWCGLILTDQPGPSGKVMRHCVIDPATRGKVSHGICPDCQREEMAKAGLTMEEPHAADDQQEQVQGV